MICGKIGKKSISSYDDILVDSSKNSDNIDLDGSDIENDDVDESQFDNCEDESDIESENDLAEEILNDAVVLDFGSYSSRIGYAGEDMPKVK